MGKREIAAISYLDQQFKYKSADKITHASAGATVSTRKRAEEAQILSRHLGQKQVYLRKHKHIASSPQRHSRQRHLAWLNWPIQIFEIGDWNFCFCFIAFSGFPRFAVSCLANRSFALRCWGVWAWIYELWNSREGSRVHTMIQIRPE